MAEEDGAMGEPAVKIAGFDEVSHLVSGSDPEVARLIEAANAIGDMDWLAAQIEALVVQRLPRGVRLATPEEIEAPQREVRRFIRQAAKPLVARGWHGTGTRFVFDAPSGHWADIKFDVRPGPAPVLIFPFAVVGSPSLLRIYGGDGQRPRAWGSGHASLLWQTWIEYDPESTKGPKRLPIPYLSQEKPGILLGRNNAQGWLTDLLGELAATMEALCSDRPLRDWMVERGLSAVRPLRDAVLLSRRLGDLKQQTDLLERLRVESEESESYLMALTPPIRRNDRGRDPLFWSHDRFMRFVAELED